MEMYRSTIHHNLLWIEIIIKCSERDWFAVVLSSLLE